MQLPRVHPWCCEDVAYPVGVDMPATRDSSEWRTCLFSRCVVVAPYGLPETGCCRCLRVSRLWYQTHHAFVPVYLPGGQRHYLASAYEWRGRGPQVCGLHAVSLLFGAIEAPHDIYWVWMLVYHDGEFRDGIWILLADYVVVDDCSHAPIRGVAPRRAIGYATVASIAASCMHTNNLNVLPGFAITWDDPCVQSPERCVDPPELGELCHGRIPPGLIVRLWGPPVNDNSGCRLSGHGFVLTRRPDDVHGHGEIICQDERRSAVYEGTILECTLGHVSLPIRVTLYRPYDPEFRQLLEVALQLEGGTYVKRVRECEELPQLTFRVNERLFGLLPVSEARIELYDGPPTPADAGVWCLPRWPPPCPRPARLLAELEVEHPCVCMENHEGRCCVTLSKMMGERLVIFRFELPCVSRGELDEQVGCCGWQGTIVISPVDVRATLGHEVVFQSTADLQLRTLYVVLGYAGVVRAEWRAYLGQLWGQDLWMTWTYGDSSYERTEDPVVHRGRGFWFVDINGEGISCFGLSRLQALP